MIRSVSVATGCMITAFGLGGAVLPVLPVLPGAIGTASASPDDESRVARSAESSSGEARTTRHVPPKAVPPKTISLPTASTELSTSRARAARPRLSKPSASDRGGSDAPATVSPAVAPPVAHAVKNPATGLLTSVAALFNNQTPQLHPTQSTQSPAGVITGRLNAVDPDSSRLTFAVAEAPANGSAVVGADGSWTYTPDPPMVLAGGTDAFRVTVSDAASGFAIHGLAGLLHLLSFGLFGSKGDSSTSTVTIAVAPIATGNNPPTGRASVTGVDSTTGIVSGSVNGSDPDGDPLTFTAQSTTSKGNVELNAATGSFTYTPTTQARRNAAAPEATDADRHDGFSVSITDGHGGVATVAVVVDVSPAEQPAPAAGQLRPADLAFDGFFRVPTGQLAAGQNATLAYGGAAMASRVVDGQRHFLFTGHRYANDPLIELVAPPTLGEEPGNAPAATVYRYWGDIYGGRKVTAEEPDPGQGNANWTEGLLWDDTNQRLLWSYGNWYAALRTNNPVLGATKLGADGSVTVQGPWRTTSESQQTRSFAVFLSQAVSAATGGATLGLGGKMQSINASASWGLSLHVIGSATGDPGTPIVARTLISHSISPAVRRTPRAADYEVARNPDGSLDSAGTEPPADGVGFWTELDETTGAVFVHTGSDTRSALIYSGGQASGLIWYGSDLEHGVVDGRGYNGSGNHAQNYRPVLWFVSEADLVAAADGGLSPDQVNPYATIDLIAQFPELSFLTGLSAGQPVFAEDEGRLYVPFAGGTIAGGEPYPLVAVFEIAS